MEQESTDPPRRRRGARAVTLGQRDRLILAFAAEHRLLVLDQVAYLLGVGADEADANLEALRQAALIRDARPYDSAPVGEQITRAGLRAVGSDLPSPRPSDPGGYLHDVGVGWLWLAARSGALGAMRGMVSERQMRSVDGRGEDRAHRFGVRLGGVGPGGRERLHYPDLLLETPSGRRVALELELTRKSPARRETILGGYAADPRIDAVVYMVDRPSVARGIARSALQMGISHLVYVQPISFDPPGAADLGAQAGRDRARAGARRSPPPRHRQAEALAR
jgi:hypothetical protein